MVNKFLTWKHILIPLCILFDSSLFAQEAAAAPVGAEPVTIIITVRGLEPMSVTVPMPASVVPGNIAASIVRPEAQIIEKKPPKSAMQFKDAPEAGYWYKIRKGDTLADGPRSIAGRAYGDSEKWREIWDANTFRTSNPKRLYPGEKCWIPEQMAAGPEAIAEAVVQIVIEKEMEAVSEAVGKAEAEKPAPEIVVIAAPQAEGKPFAVGLGLEVNSNHPEPTGLAYGMLINADYRTFSHFAFGLKTGFSVNEMTNTIETAATAHFVWPFKRLDLFAKVGVGASVIIYEDMEFLRFLLEGDIGVRIPLKTFSVGGLKTEWFYLEPFVRFGGPFSWGAGIVAGKTFMISVL